MPEGSDIAVKELIRIALEAKKISHPKVRKLMVESVLDNLDELVSSSEKELIDGKPVSSYARYHELKKLHLDAFREYIGEISAQTLAETALELVEEMKKRETLFSILTEINRIAKKESKLNSLYLHFTLYKEIFEVYMHHVKVIGRGMGIKKHEAGGVIRAFKEKHGSYEELVQDLDTQYRNASAHILYQVDPSSCSVILEDGTSLNEPKIRAEKEEIILRIISFQNAFSIVYNEVLKSIA